MRIQPITTLCVLTLTLLAGGCGIEPETMESLRNAVQTVSAQGSRLDGDDLAQAGEASAFQPPYPERIDPFSFPDSAPVSNQTGTTITSVAQVEVLGFADVQEPRVFLRTKESTKSLKVGEITDGVEVVAIHAPTVDLRMGTLVWTASMFDNTSIGK